MDVPWTLSELVAEAAASIATLPAPKNGQVRAVPDERTVRYYGTLGLLDRPVATRGRTALYGRKHLAQVVAIKRLQSAGRSLAEIQALWPTLDDVTLARMSGIALAPKGRAARREFWKRDAAPATGAEIPKWPGRPIPGQPGEDDTPAAGGAQVAEARVASAPVELRVELAPGSHIVLVVGLADDVTHTIHPADVRAIRAAAAPLVAELARRGLIAREDDTAGTLEDT